MSDDWLYRLAGAAAMMGGALRVATAFVSWNASSAQFEVLAITIDLLCLFGLLGIYLASRAQVGAVGLLAFIVAASGIASIVGPDSKVFGIDTYQAGVAVIAFGLMVFGAMLLRARFLFRLAGCCWIFSIVAGVAGVLAGLGSEGFLVGGVLFGAGFIFGGLGLV